MERKLKKALNSYLMDIFKRLPDSFRKRRKFVHLLKQNILNYIDENSIIKIEDIYIQFGSVDSIVEAYLADMPYKYLKKQIKITRTQKIAVLIIVLIFTISTFIYNMYLESITPTEIEIETNVGVPVEID